MSFLLKGKIKDLSTVNQLLIQIQEFQDKEKSFNDAKEFCDPEKYEQLWTFPRSQSILKWPEIRRNSESRFLLATWHTKLIRYIGTSSTYPRRIISIILREFKEFDSVFLRIYVNWHRQNYKTVQRNKTRIEGFCSTNSGIYQELFDICPLYRAGGTYFSIWMVQILEIRSRSCISINFRTRQTFDARKSISRMKYAPL